MRGELDALIKRMHEGGILYAEAVREFRKAFIATVLRENNGNQSKAARELRMHRNTLSRIASALELDVHTLRSGGRRPPRRAPSLSVVSKMSR
jgi:DNA-binding NtrC family response regulator